jgi:protein-S-isoprenylcysteine O-methyltransferase Ste14
MARKTFKAWLSNWIPKVWERSTFVLVSGVAMLLLIALWQGMPDSIWKVTDEFIRYGIVAGSLLGMAYVVATSFITGHFELFGLRQAYLYMMGREYTPLAFKRKWFYTYSRHPMMLGILFVLWCTPDMSMTRFSLAVLMTIYLFKGIKFEEKSLVQEFGEGYQSYQKEVGTFFTFKSN